MEIRKFEEKDYKAFTLFRDQWALATSGAIDDYNTCTIAWGSIGTLWTAPGKSGSIITVYIHPGRYTFEFMKKNDYFTVSFFPSEYKQALSYLGRKSGRDEDKVAAAGLTPVAIKESVTFKEANLTFYCRKLYQHSFSKEDIAPEIQKYYKEHPAAYPPDESGEWQPHWVFVGEILCALDSNE